MELFQRVKYLAREVAGSETRLAEKLGLPQRKLNGYLSEKSQKNLWEYLPAILENYPHISRDWLYFGEGQMLRAQTVGVPPLRAVEPTLAAVSAPPRDGDLAQRLLDTYAQNARLAEELVRVNEERRKLMELLPLDKRTEDAPMPTSVPGERAEQRRE